MGGKKSAPAPKPVSPQEQAQQNLQALLQTVPQAAELQAQVEEKFIPRLTEARRKALAESFPEQQGVVDELTRRIFENLQSPAGITPEQQEAVNARRGRAQEELQRAVRLRGELGGGLFGGRNIQQEQRAVSELQQAFAEQDIERDRINRLNALSAALPIFQFISGQQGLAQPSFINPVVSPNQQFAGAVSQSNLAANLAQREAESRRALIGSLFQGLGQGASTAFGA